MSSSAPRRLHLVLALLAVLLSSAADTSWGAGLGRGDGPIASGALGSWDGQDAVLRSPAETGISAIGETGGERVPAHLSGGRWPSRVRPWSSVGIEREEGRVRRAPIGRIRLRSPPHRLPV